MGSDTKATNKLLTTPLWIFSSAEDDIVPVGLSRNVYQEMIKLGGNKVKYIEYPRLMGQVLWAKKCYRISFFAEQEVVDDFSEIKNFPKLFWKVYFQIRFHQKSSVYRTTKVPSVISVGWLPSGLATLQENVPVTLYALAVKSEPSATTLVIFKFSPAVWLT